MAGSIPPVRIGQGWDTHRLVAGRPLILGGVEIPSEIGLSGHSDADVLFHAVTDAVLGALALGDIGMHFPDTAPEWKDARKHSVPAACLGFSHKPWLFASECGFDNSAGAAKAEELPGRDS